MRAKNWNRMQNATDLGVFYQCEEYTCMLYIILLRAHFSQNVKYWYEMRYLYLPRAVRILYQFFKVWILRSVKFAVRHGPLWKYTTLVPKISPFSAPGRNYLSPRMGYIWALSQENMSSVFPTKRVSNGKGIMTTVIPFPRNRQTS